MSDPLGDFAKHLFGPAQPNELLWQDVQQAIQSNGAPLRQLINYLEATRHMPDIQSLHFCVVEILKQMHRDDQMQSGC